MNSAPVWELSGSAGDRPTPGIKRGGVQTGQSGRPLPVRTTGKETVMKAILTSLPLIAVASNAAAHEGHIAPLAGHAHGEVLAIVVAAAVAAAIYIANRRA